MRGKERQRSLSGIIGRWVLFIVIVLLIVFAVLIVVNNRTVAGDNTMYPTIETGDLLWVIGTREMGEKLLLAGYLDPKKLKRKKPREKDIAMIHE